MNINDILAKKQMTKYQLSKISGVSTTTINDICKGKVNIKNCTGETLYKLAKALNVSIESLLEEVMDKRVAFTTFKGNVCHMVKDMGDREFMRDVVRSKRIFAYLQKGWHFEALYMLAMFDYLCRENNLPSYEAYEDLRKLRFTEPIYAEGVVLLSIGLNSDEPKKQSMEEAIPEFLRHNIIEAEVRDVA